MKMRFFSQIFFNVSTFVAFNEALLLHSPSGTKGQRRAIMFPHSVSDLPYGGTALFFQKDPTETNFDIDKPPTLINKSNIMILDRREESKDLSSFDDTRFPGFDENDRFECDPSVAYWRDFQSRGDTSTQHNIQKIATIAQKIVRDGNNFSQTSYFGRHIARTAYFVMNAVLGDVAFRFSQRDNKNNDYEAGLIGKGFLPMGVTGEIATLMILETLMSYEQEYFQWIAKDIYREPWDMKSLDHRQSNPINIITQTGRFMREAAETLGRRSRGTKRDKQVKFFTSSHSAGNAKGEYGTKIYPEYYKTAFHYQGDGWMSTESANVYETSTETLFLGRQDSMQRTTLPPLIDLSKKFVGYHNRPMRVLEVACGTGRFMTFVRDNLPLDAEYTAVDLSPFYLEKASDNDGYWRKTRMREEQDKTRNPVEISPANLVQAQAEALPFPDESFDAVICVYLFHELPREIRAKAAAEMARVVSPGGTVVFTDSLQKGDRPSVDYVLQNFQDMNEPFHIDYINDDIGAHFETQGMIPKTKMLRSSTKSLSFSKPGDLSKCS